MYNLLTVIFKMSTAYQCCRYERGCYSGWSVSADNKWGGLCGGSHCGG